MFSPMLYIFSEREGSGQVFRKGNGKKKGKEKIKDIIYNGATLKDSVLGHLCSYFVRAIAEVKTANSRTALVLILLMAAATLF